MITNENGKDDCRIRHARHGQFCFGLLSTHQHATGEIGPTASTETVKKPLAKCEYEKLCKHYLSKAKCSSGLHGKQSL